MKSAMHDEFNKHVVILLLAAVMGLVVNIAFAANSSAVALNADEQRVMLENKLALADYILSTSSMTKKVLASDNQAGIELINLARKDYLQAKKLLADKQWSQADALLTKLMQSVATLSADNARANKEKQQLNSLDQEYQNLVLTINSLVEAMQQEINDSGAEHLTSVKLAHIMDTADTLAKEGRYVQANALLNEIYYNLKLFIKQQRNNKTLVYALDFKSKQEEYEYELKRYNSFSLIIKMSLEKENVPDKIHFLAEKYQKQAEQRRQDAARLALDKQYIEAIKVQEQASTQLIRALRMMGLMAF